MKDHTEHAFSHQLEAGFDPDMIELEGAGVGLWLEDDRRRRVVSAETQDCDAKVKVLLEELNARCTHLPKHERRDVTGLCLSDLIGHVERTHHAYLKRELPRLDRLSRELEHDHGLREPRYRKLREALRALIRDLVPHLIKEERYLFPMIRSVITSALDADDRPLDKLVRRMHFDHANMQLALKELRDLTCFYTAPAGATTPARALMVGLQALDHDFQRHSLLEDALLIPRALRLERV